ncbi:OmpA family protein [Roseomonas populi]|uniref:OmpA family protein n=1 Tax=Roseomonas populi TaxID=3121582 RepID=A0ABT1X450_9PROT|nr:OmpA family protein [Roseomonas pecuniae]MCR0981947.1 OmpA family protein [Roseomonas pecuniae]
MMLRFEPGRSELTLTAQRTTLTMLENFLGPLAGQRMRVEGHCDGAEERLGGMALSRRRAEVVTAFLVLNGVPAGLITTTAVGATRPLILTPPRTPEEGNRRVEVWVV